LQGCPIKVGGRFDASGNNLQDLEDSPKEIGHMFLINYRGQLPLLRTLVAQEINLLTDHTVDKQVGIVLNKYAGRGRRGAIQAARALITKGEEMQQLHGLWDNPFEANARW
jgi:hypothetical protein